MTVRVAHKHSNIKVCVTGVEADAVHQLYVLGEIRYTATQSSFTAAIPWFPRVCVNHSLLQYDIGPLQVAAIRDLLTAYQLSGTLGLFYEKFTHVAVALRVISPKH